MVSPYIRAHRLRTELIALREEAGLTTNELGKRIGKDRQPISRLENGRSLDIDVVMAILETLNVDGDRYTEIVQAAHDAASKGWWETNTRIMGRRQALVADLEAGATQIREYQQTTIPGLLQTPEFTRARIQADSSPLQPGVTVEGLLKGRAGRQRRLRQPDSPTYEVILNEFAIRRRSAPPDTLRDQLLHLVDKADDERITIRVLPVEAEIADYNVPATSFTIFTYPNPGDPTVVGIETVVSNEVLTDEADVEPHIRMFTSLHTAAMTVEQSQQFLRQAADKLP